MNRYEKLRDNLLQDPEIKEGYDKEMDDFQLSMSLIAIRQELNLTQSEFAKKTGIDQSMISKLETGAYNPSIAFLQKVANGVGKKLHIEFR